MSFGIVAHAAIAIDVVVFRGLEGVLGFWVDSDEFYFLVAAVFLACLGVTFVRLYRLRPLLAGWAFKDAVKDFDFLWASLFPALFTVGVIAMLCEIFGCWEDILWSEQIFVSGSSLTETPRYWGVIGMLGCSWAIWLTALKMGWRNERQLIGMQTIANIVLWLSPVMVAIALPIHIAKVSPDWGLPTLLDPEFRGTYTSLFLAVLSFAWAATWLAGLGWPFQKYLAICQRCQYDLRGTLAAGHVECPECGTRIPDSVCKPR